MKLTCEKMLFGGLGLCRTETGIVFVEGLMPNETAECKQIGKTGGILVFGIEKLLEKSPERREPFCKYFGICGGCDWQFMNYDAQISAKKEIFEDNLRRIGKFYDFTVPQIYFADEKNYRIRAKFSVDRKTQKIGFLSKKSHEVIAIDNCPLLSENLNKFVEEIALNYLQYTNQKEIKIIDHENGEISVGKYKFEVNNNSFFQANKFLTKKMANWCKENVENCEELLDIYGGVGLFSVFCSEKAKNITLVEIDERMAGLAQKTFEKNNIKNAKAIGISAEEFLADKKINVDCIVIDPPRIGLDKKVAEVIAKSTKKIIYISCNPTTQARDARIFANLGFKITKTAIFDCYPNTFHIETGIVLEK